MAKTINLGRALAFNGLTTSLAAVGFAYTQEEFGGGGLLSQPMFIALLTIFAAAFILGLLVAGEAASFSENEKDIEGGAIVWFGRFHSLFLVVGLIILGVLFVGGAQENGSSEKCQATMKLADGLELSVSYACDAVSMEKPDA